MSTYYEWEDFKDIYLEDSFVLDIKESERELSFVVEIVLKQDHPLYQSPKSGEQYSYKKGNLVFQNLKSIKWLKVCTQAFVDANDEVDYGNIDSLTLSEEGYHLSGDWGEVVVRSSPIKLNWL